MSILIDGQELGPFIDVGAPWMGGREYRGKCLEEEGKIIETWIKEYSKGMKVRVQDHKYPRMRSSTILEIDEINFEWKENVFHFQIIFSDIR
jgi:hypothetical protein